MKRTNFYVTASFAALLCVAALGIGAAVDTPRTLMSKGDYTTGRNAIQSETRAALSRCRDQEGAAKDLCKAQVRADERVKLADLQARYHGTVLAAEDARTARAQASYDVAKARCGELKGDNRLGCLRTAREDKGKSLARLAST